MVQSTPMTKIRHSFFVMVIQSGLVHFHKLWISGFGLWPLPLLPFLSELGHVCIHGSQNTLHADPSQGTVHLEVQGHFPLHPLILIIKNVMQQHHHKFVPLHSCRKWLSQQVCRIFMRVHIGCSPFITCNSLSHKVVSNAL